MAEHDPHSSQPPVDAIPVATVYQPRYSMPPAAPPPPPSSGYGRRYERPGIITAVGVISIVVAGLSMAGGGISGLYTFGIYMAAQFSRSMNPTTTTTTVTVGPAVVPEADAIGVQGLRERDRRIIGRAIEQVHPLTSVRQQVFDRLLAQSGAAIFVEVDDSDQSLSIQEVKRLITEDGVLPSAKESVAGADFLVTETGRVEVYDTHAVFYPNDGTPSTSVTAAGDVTEGAFTITPETVDAMIAKHQKTFAVKLTDAQRQRLHTILEDPNQQFITPGGGEPVDQLVSLYAMDDGQVVVSFSSGTIWLNPDGTVKQQYMNTGGGFAGGTPFAISDGALSAVIAGIALSLGLAVFLLVSGILTLRQSLRGRQLHLIYAGVKIVAAALLSYGWLRLIRSMGAEVNDDAPMLATGVAATVFVIGVLYPIALLIVMNLRSVKNYYAGGKLG